MQGVELVNCSCEWGCPCQFNSLPTHGHCRALTFVQVERGRYGDVAARRAATGACWRRGRARSTSATARSGRRGRTRRRPAACRARSHRPGARHRARHADWQVFSTTVTTCCRRCTRRIELDDRRGERNGVAVRAGLGEEHGGADPQPQDRRAAAGARHAARRLRVHRSGVRRRQHQGRPATFRSTSATRTPTWRACTGPRTAWSARRAARCRDRAHDPRTGGDPARSLARRSARCSSSLAPAGRGSCRWRATCTAHDRRRRPG